MNSKTYMKKESSFGFVNWSITFSILRHKQGSGFSVSCGKTEKKNVVSPFNQEKCKLLILMDCGRDTAKDQNLPLN